MRATLFGLGALAGLATANINFSWVNPSCEFNTIGANNCLTGQHCTEQNTYVLLAELSPLLLISSRCVADLKSDKSKLVSRSHLRVPRAKKQTTKYSTDGQCGPANGNLLCDPNSTVYTGTCCSQYGWCGNTPAHCGTGCLSGCSGTAASSVKPAATPTAVAGTAPRDDGRCGKDFAGATCDANGPYGGCCSSYG